MKPSELHIVEESRFYSLVIWLSEREFQIMLLAVVLGQHAAVALVLLKCIRRYQVILRSDFLYPISVAMALPFLPLVVFFSLPFLVLDDGREKTLTSRPQSQALERLNLWLQLRARSQTAWKKLPWWRRLPGRNDQLKDRLEDGRLASRWRVAYRVKVGSVFFDAASVSWALLWATDHDWLIGKRFVWWLVTILLIGTIVGVVIAAVFYLMTCLRRLILQPVRILQADANSMAAYLLGSQAGYLLGFLVGYGLYLGDVEEFGLFLLFTGSVGLIFILSRSLLSSVIFLPKTPASEDRPEMFIFISLLLAIAMALVFLINPGSLAEWLPQSSQLEIFRWGIFLAALGGVVLSGYLVTRLVPNRWKTWRRRGMLFMAFVPLGGLAVPFWLIWRAREERRIQGTSAATSS